MLEEELRFVSILNHKAIQHQIATDEYLSYTFVTWKLDVINYITATALTVVTVALVRL